jgi:hypothetical protein
MTDIRAELERIESDAWPMVLPSESRSVARHLAAALLTTLEPLDTGTRAAEPELLSALQMLGQTYGSQNVALAAASLTNRDILIARLARADAAALLTEVLSARVGRHVEAAAALMGGTDG